MENFIRIIAPSEDNTPKGYLSVFLAGSIETGKARIWYDEAIESITKHAPNRNFAFYIPRRKEEFKPEDEVSQIKWDQEHLKSCDYIFMYLDPNTKSPNSLLEFGEFLHTGKLFVAVDPIFYRYRELVTIANVNEQRYHVNSSVSSAALVMANQIEYDHPTQQFTKFVKDVEQKWMTTKPLDKSIKYLKIPTSEIPDEFEESNFGKHSYVASNVLDALQKDGFGVSYVQDNLIIFKATDQPATVPTTITGNAFADQIINKFNNNDCEHDEYGAYVCLSEFEIPDAFKRPFPIYFFKLTKEAEGALASQGYVCQYNVGDDFGSVTIRRSF